MPAQKGVNVEVVSQLLNRRFGLSLTDTGDTLVHLYDWYFLPRQPKVIEVTSVQLKSSLH